MFPDLDNSICIWSFMGIITLHISTNWLLYFLPITQNFLFCWLIYSCKCFYELQVTAWRNVVVSFGFFQIVLNYDIYILVDVYTHRSKQVFEFLEKSMIKVFRTIYIYIYCTFMLMHFFSKTLNVFQQQIIYFFSRGMIGIGGNQTPDRTSAPRETVFRLL